MEARDRAEQECLEAVVPQEKEKKWKLCDEAKRSAEQVQHENEKHEVEA